jgi:hypothetical protein
LLGLVRRPAVAGAETRKIQQACGQSQNAADGIGSTYAHWSCFGPDFSCRAFMIVS